MAKKKHVVVEEIEIEELDESELEDEDLEEVEEELEEEDLEDLDLEELEGELEEELEEEVEEEKPKAKPKKKKAPAKKKVPEVKVSDLKVGSTLKDHKGNNVKVTKELVAQMIAFEKANPKSHAVWKGKITGTFLYFKYYQDNPVEKKAPKKAKK